jgi:hypothetical protein
VPLLSVFFSPFSFLSVLVLLTVGLYYVVFVNRSLASLWSIGTTSPNEKENLNPFFTPLMTLFELTLLRCPDGGPEVTIKSSGDNAFFFIFSYSTPLIRKFFVSLQLTFVDNLGRLITHAMHELRLQISMAAPPFS